MYTHTHTRCRISLEDPSWGGLTIMSTTYISERPVKQAK